VRPDFPGTPTTGLIRPPYSKEPTTEYSVEWTLIGHSSLNVKDVSFAQPWICFGVSKMRQIGGHSLDGTISKVKNVEVVSEDGMIGVLLLSGQTPIPLEFHAEDAKTLANELLAAIRQARKTKAPKAKAPKVKVTSSRGKARTPSRKR
jgi:hypothetical protein